MNIAKSLLLGHLLAVVLAIAPAHALADDGAGNAIATATVLLDRLDAGEYEAATTDFNSQMKAALGTAQLAGVQLQLESAGAVKSRDEAKVSDRGEHTVVVIRIHREHAAIDATVAIDGEGKVAGLHFAPAADGNAK